MPIKVSIYLLLRAVQSILYSLELFFLLYFYLVDTLNLYLLDVISGSMIFSITHKRVRGPIHIVHSENWLVYSYFNEKGRRTEIATLELYEGKIQSNTTGKDSHKFSMM